MLIDSIQEFGDAMLGEKQKVGSSGEMPLSIPPHSQRTRLQSSNAAGDLIAGREVEDRDRAPSQISTASQIDGAPVVAGKKNTFISRELALNLFAKAR